MSLVSLAHRVIKDILMASAQLHCSKPQQMLQLTLSETVLLLILPSILLGEYPLQVHFPYLGFCRVVLITSFFVVGIVSSFAGRPGIFPRADGVGTNAAMDAPRRIAFDKAGILYMTESPIGTIRAITTAGETVACSKLSNDCAC